MRDRRVYICSPFRGDAEKDIRKAQDYCREAAETFGDVVPVAPHVYCTQFLDDNSVGEREAGMEIRRAMLDMCDEVWVYGPPTAEMEKEIAYAGKEGIPVMDAKDVYLNPQKEQEEPGAYIELLEDGNTIRMGMDTIGFLYKWLRRNPGKDYILKTIDEETDEALEELAEEHEREQLKRFDKFGTLTEDE